MSIYANTASVNQHNDVETRLKALWGLVGYPGLLAIVGQLVARKGASGTVGQYLGQCQLVQIYAETIRSKKG